MKKWLVAFLVSSTLQANVPAKAQKFIDAKDYLGLRIALKNEATRIGTVKEWFEYRKLIFTHREDLGHDLLVQWDSKFSRFTRDLVGANLSELWERADQLMLRKNFSKSFEAYQKILQWLHSRKDKMKASRDGTLAEYVEMIEVIEPYLLQSMGRALYGARRFEESYIVFDWIPHEFVHFKQVLFEKMWAGFRSGRIDQTLGAIAAQYSVYYNRDVPPEAYLVEIYLYKKLCRNQETNRVLAIVENVKKIYASRQIKFDDWVNADAERFFLWKIAQPKTGQALVASVSSAARQEERKKITTLLRERFKQDYIKKIEELDQVIAYSQLATLTVGDNRLKPIEKLPDRTEILNKGYEIWPSNGSEEWADEVGRQRYMGESLCAKGS